MVDNLSCSVFRHAGQNKEPENGQNKYMMRRGKEQLSRTIGDRELVIGKLDRPLRRSYSPRIRVRFSFFGGDSSAIVESTGLAALPEARRSREERTRICSGGAVPKTEAAARARRVSIREGNVGDVLEATEPSSINSIASRSSASAVRSAITKASIRPGRRSRTSRKT